MKKVCVITLHRVFNYGSVLQAYATQKIVEKSGYRCEIIDYVSNQRTFKRQIFYVPQNIKKSFIKKFLYIISRFPNNVKKWNVYNKFCKRYLNLTKQRYINIEDLRKKPPKADIYLTGSDQVWNSDYNEGIDESFFLNFGEDSTKRIAYAASIGMDEIYESEKSRFKELLSRYSHITLREIKGQYLLKEIFNKEFPVVLDPTLMLKKDEWNLLSKEVIVKDYILVVILYNEECNIPNIAKKLSDISGLKIIEIVWNPLKKRKWDTLYGVSTEEFIGYIKNSRYVVTNSFHVTVFSIIFEKQFIAVRREMYNNRIESLLNSLGIENNYIEKSDDISKIIENEIDYIEVTAKLDELRNSSMNELKRMLEE